MHKRGKFSVTIVCGFSLWVIALPRGNCGLLRLLVDGGEYSGAVTFGSDCTAGKKLYRHFVASNPSYNCSRSHGFHVSFQWEDSINHLITTSKVLTTVLQNAQTPTHIVYNSGVCRCLIRYVITHRSVITIFRVAVLHGLHYFICISMYRVVIKDNLA